MGERRLADRLGVGVVKGGLILSQLAKVKGLPVDYLGKWGWRTQRVKGGEAGVIIPWYNFDGVQTVAQANHIRHYIDKCPDGGPRFTWDKPKHVRLIPYGAWRNTEWLEQYKANGARSYIWLCESELDCVTLWFHGIPANAYGGAHFWKPEWADHYKDFGTVLIAQEPDEAGRTTRSIAVDLFEALGRDPRTPDVLIVPFPTETKDANALHLRVGCSREPFTEGLNKLVENSVQATKVLREVEAEAADEALRQEEIRKREEEEERKKLETLAAGLLEDPAILHKAIHAIEDLGVVGERRNIGAIRP